MIREYGEEARMAFYPLMHSITSAHNGLFIDEILIPGLTLREGTVERTFGPDDLTVLFIAERRLAREPGISEEHADRRWVSYEDLSVMNLTPHTRSIMPHLRGNIRTLAKDYFLRMYPVLSIHGVTYPLTIYIADRFGIDPQGVPTHISAEDLHGDYTRQGLERALIRMMPRLNTGSSQQLSYLSP